MKKIIFILILVLSITLLNCQDTVALTLKVKGTVNLLRERVTTSLITGAELLNKDVLESGEEAFAALKFIDGSSIVKLFPNSILEINAEQDQKNLKKKTMLNMGELWAKVTKQTGAFEIETPTTVVSVRGTNFLVGVDENGYTNLTTFSGTVEMKNKQDNQSVLVGEGEKAYSTGSGEIIVSEFALEDLDPEILELIESESEGETLKIELEGPDGEKRTINIEFE